MSESEWTEIRRWPGYRVYRSEITKSRKPCVCGCDASVGTANWNVPEKVPLLPSKAPFSQRFEEAVGQACKSAALRRVARQFGIAASTVRSIDLRYLRRWAQERRRPACGRWGR